VKQTARASTGYLSPSISKRIRDLALYLLIATVICIGIVWFAYKSDGTGAESISRWGGLILNTAILYGYVLKESTPFWHAWGFWRAFISVLSIHSLVFIVIFQHVEHWSVLWFLFMYTVEIPALAIISDWAVHLTGANPRFRTDARHKRQMSLVHE
jgi:hypothetical protein